MKIECVRFKNLNSLYGEWDIDLTHPHFVNHGLFVITGPTGSGKTTILDAICLSLFGETPRLGTIAASGNGIMSCGSGECFSEVTFAVKTKRYRCFWSQQRAYKKPEGELQQPKHHIEEVLPDGTGKPLEAQKKKVIAKIMKITGLDFEQFRLSMMLAQGDFAAFLKASDNERASILEQIVSTETYRNISIQTFERAQSEQASLTQLMDQRGNIDILTNEQVAAHRQKIAQLDHTGKELRNTFATVRQEIDWLAGMAALVKEISGIGRDLELVQAECKSFEPREAQLALAERAQRLVGQYDSLKLHRKQHAQGRKELAMLEGQLPKLREEAERQSNELAKTLDALEKFRGGEELAESAIKEKRALDGLITAQQGVVGEAGQRCHAQRELIAKEQRVRKHTQMEYARKHEEQERADVYWREHEKDKWLVSEFSGLEEKLRQLVDLQSRYRRLESRKEDGLTKLTQAEHAQDNARATLEKREAEAALAQKALDAAQTALDEILKGRSLQEYREEQGQLEQELEKQKDIERFATARESLRNGTPCPLCGATEHPYGTGHVPSTSPLRAHIADLTAIMRRAENQRDICARETIKSQKNLVAKLGAANDVQSATKDWENAQEKVEDIERQLAETRAKMEIEQRSILEKCPDLNGIADVFADVPSLLCDLRERRDKWQDAEAKRASLLVTIQALHNRLEQYDKSLDEKQATLRGLEAELQGKQSALRQKLDERRTLGETSADDDELQLKKTGARLETEASMARDACNTAQNAYQTRQASIETLRNNVRKQGETLQKAEAQFAVALAGQSFVDEDAFRSARMPDEEMAMLAMRRKDLAARKTALEEKQQDRSAALERERAKRLTEESREALESKASALQDALVEQSEETGRLREILDNNEREVAKAKDLQMQIDARKKECDRWKKLSDLIGSRNGDKFVKFAQGLTFRNLVASANRELVNMFPRYSLSVPQHDDSKSPFSLNVIDHDQADSSRPIANLSGGETFIASLALALGLARLASRKMRVDSLFLDEGFGTLDENTLETVLDSLAGLRQNGKLIGVISHIQALTERIPTRIAVVPNSSGGRSRISGPGCREL